MRFLRREVPIKHIAIACPVPVYVTLFSCFLLLTRQPGSHLNTAISRTKSRTTNDVIRNYQNDKPTAIAVRLQIPESLNGDISYLTQYTTETINRYMLQI